jgi:cytochrome c-type biogenesis protein CcmH/NrfG
MLISAVNAYHKKFNRGYMAQNRKKENTPPPRDKKKTNQLFTYFVIFVFGFVTGIAFTVIKSKTPEPAPSTIAGEQPPHDEETRQAILNLEAEVTANPENFQSWVRLGHLYYDTDQPEKAIAAYNKSLELHSGDANLLTDLGVMYRRTEQPEKAIELFNKAIEKEPVHQPSRFNKGIVLMYDLNDPAGAVEAWEGLLKLNPDAQSADGQPIREYVDQIKADMAEKK